MQPRYLGSCIPPLVTYGPQARQYRYAKTANLNSTKWTLINGNAIFRGNGSSSCETLLVTSVLPFRRRLMCDSYEWYSQWYRVCNKLHTYFEVRDCTNLHYYFIPNKSHVNEIQIFNVAWFFRANIYSLAFALIKVNCFFFAWNTMFPNF